MMSTFIQFFKAVPVHSLSTYLAVAAAPQCFIYQMFYYLFPGWNLDLHDISYSCLTSPPLRNMKKTLQKCQLVHDRAITTERVS